MAIADRRRAGSSRGLPVVMALATISAVILVAAPTAIAAFSAVCEQYPDLPQCQAAGGAGGGSPSVGGGGDAGHGVGAGARGNADTGAGPGATGDLEPLSAVGGSLPGAGDAGSASRAGELPFTGYPLTPLVLLLLVLLAGGIAARAYIAARHRIAVRPRGSAT